MASKALNHIAHGPLTMLMRPVSGHLFFTHFRMDDAASIEKGFGGDFIFIKTPLKCVWSAGD
ncbi:MAG: hypothetical protein WD708_00395 [Kiritimatiellia bacterium]